MEVSTPVSTLTRALNVLLSDPDYQLLRRTHYSCSYVGDYVNLLETQMCQVLHWLFNPREGHMQQDFFIKRLLISVLNEGARLEETDKFQLLSRSYHDAQVFKEFVIDNKQRIDIVIMDALSKTLIVIERKDGDTAKKGQLTAYRRFIQDNYPDWLSVFILSDSHEKQHKYWDDAYTQIGDQWLSEALADICKLHDLDKKVKNELSNIRRIVDSEYKYPIEKTWYKVSKRLCERHQNCLSLLKNTTIIANGTQLTLSELTPEKFFGLVPYEPTILTEPLYHLVQSQHLYLSDLESFYLFEKLEEELAKSIPYGAVFASEIEENELNFTHVGQIRELGLESGYWPYYLSLRREERDDGEPNYYTLSLVLNKKSDEQLHWIIDRLKEKYDFEASRSRVNFRLTLLDRIDTLDITPGSQLHSAYMKFFRTVINLGE
ncbi:TPA: PD-(D/E)XK nuclease family protein [Vibrio vulnificus]|nr:PD-(D/E)XK nuclease family protein [Vibrio vulnificus]